MKKFMGFVVVFVGLTGGCLAQTETPRIDSRQLAQRARIHDARRDGALTRRKVVRLQAEQRHIRRIERRAKADGDVNIIERRTLHRKLHMASRDIHRQRHDRQGTPD